MDFQSGAHLTPLSNVTSRYTQRKPRLLRSWFTETTDTTVTVTRLQGYDHRGGINMEAWKSAHRNKAAMVYSFTFGHGSRFVGCPVVSVARNPGVENYPFGLPSYISERCCTLKQYSLCLFRRIQDLTA